MVTNQNIIKRKFPYIDTFDHELTDVISTMRDPTVGMFGHIEIISDMDVYKRIIYTDCILRGSVLKKYRQVLVEFKELEKCLTGYQCNM